MASPEISDFELLSRANAGDADAFGGLFVRHGDAVYRYCFRRTGSWSEAEDLTSITFLEAWKRRGEVRPSGDSLLPWLLGVSTNLDRNRTRGERRYSELLRRLPTSADVPDFADDCASKLDAEQDAARMFQALSILDARDRDAVVLSLWHGLTTAETALALGVPAGTVKSRLHRSRAQLGPALQQLRERATNRIGEGER